MNGVGVHANLLRLVGNSLQIEAGSHLKLIDSCITQLKAEGPSRTWTESKEEETEEESEEESPPSEGSNA